MVAIEVDEDADIDGADGGDDAKEGNRGELVDELHADEDDEADDDEQDRAVHAVVVELRVGVHDVRAGNGHRSSHQVGLK